MMGSPIARAWRVLLLSLAFVATGHATSPTPVTVEAADGFALAASYFDPGRSGPAVLLLHQCNADRTMWDDLGTALAHAGVHVLALDSRGYGDSKAEGVDIANRAKRPEILAHTSADVRAAFRTLVAMEGVDPRRIGLGGASCGGPRSIELAAGVAGVRTIVFLSTALFEESLALHGEKLKDLPVLAITAEHDGVTTESLLTMFRASESPDSRLVLYKGSEHGWPLFEQDPGLVDAIVEWYRRQL